MSSPYFLKTNPFQKKYVVDTEDFDSQPFIPTESAKRLENEINWSFNSGERVYYSFIGKKGIGKTSFALYIKSKIEKIKVDGKKTMIFYINKEFNKICDNGALFLYYLFFDCFPKQQNISYEEMIKGEIKKYYQIYFLFDMPEEVSEIKELRLFARFLDFIIRNHIGSIIITMNQNHYTKLSKITNIIGEDAKITTFNLMTDYDEDLMFQIASKRLAISREEGYNGDEFYPFTSDALKIIAKDSSYIPRNFIIGCGTCLLEAIVRKKKSIDENLIKDVLKPSFVTKIIENKTNDDAEKRVLLSIVNCIKIDFSGKVDNGIKLYEKLKEKKLYTPNYSTLVRRLNNLCEWGILRIEKNFQTPKGRAIEVIV